MPTPPMTDIARRLQEISTLLQLIQTMSTEAKRASTISHLWLAVEDLCDVPEDDEHSQSRIVRKIFLLIKKLRASSDPDMWDSDIAMLFEVIAYIVKPPKRIALQMPSYTNSKGTKLMPNFALPLDKIATFTITEANTTTGAFDPVDPTDTFNVSANSDPTNLNAVIGTNAAGAQALIVNWLHSVTPALTGVSVTISDSAGNTADAQLFDMVQPSRVPDQIGLDIANVTMANQPVPT